MNPIDIILCIQNGIEPFKGGALGFFHGVPDFEVDIIEVGLNQWIVFDVEVTPDNQLDLPRLLWAEKYGNDAYSGVFGDESTGWEEYARYGRPSNDGGSKSIIRSSFIITVR